jgi:hypothetical protein
MKPGLRMVLSTEDKISYIQNILETHDSFYIELEAPEDIDVVYRAFKHECLPALDDVDSGIVCVYMGWACESICGGSYVQVGEWYEKGVRLGNGVAMCALRNHYRTNIFPKVEEAERYYLMSLDHGFFKAAGRLAKLYHDQNKINLALHYYTLAVDHNPRLQTIDNLAYLYKSSSLKDPVKFFEHCFRFQNQVSRRLLVCSIKRVLKIPHSLEINRKITQVQWKKEDDVPYWIRNHQQLLQKQFHQEVIIHRYVLKIFQDWTQRYTKCALLPKEIWNIIASYL